MSTPLASRDIARAAELTADARDHVRNLILVLADSKRLLGMRYAEWLLGAPELEAGIACASMAQDEWGHARLLYSLLKDFGDDVDAIEHGRQPAEYRNMQALDREPASWPELVAMNALVDGALSLQLEALAASSYLPLRQRVQKILEEEQFHAAHGRAWVLRLSRGGDDARNEIAAAIRMYVPLVLAWFGPESATSAAVRELGVVDAAADDMRSRLADRFATLLAPSGVSDSVNTFKRSWDGFDEIARKDRGAAPDDASIAKIRGDKNRAFLMD